MKVLYFHQHFTTPEGSSGTRSYEFARALLERGHHVTMVCGSSRWAGLGSGEAGRVFRGRVDGIEVVSFPLEYSNHDGLLQRSLTFARFAVRSLAVAVQGGCDLIFATSTPLTAGVPGIAARWLRGRRFVFEIRDLWPELPRALGMRNPILLGAMSALEWSGYRSAHACIGLAPGIVEGIRRRSQAGKPVAMIPNGADLDVFRPGQRSELRVNGIGQDDFVAAFTGAHGVANGLDAVLDAAEVVQARGLERIKFLFIGDGGEKPRLVQEARRRELSNCLFLQPIPKRKLADMLGCIDCGLMVLKNVPAFYYGTSPNKFFDYIACGLPVVNNYPGWLADLIREHACGVAVPPDDPDSFADALEDLARNRDQSRVMGARARSLAERSFDRRELSKQFVDFVESVA